MNPLARVKGAGGALWRAAQREVQAAVAAADRWLSAPGNARRAAWFALALLVALTLLLPPLSLASRIASPGYARIRPGADASVPARGDETTYLEVRRGDALRTARARLVARDRLPRGVAPLPAGRSPITPAFSLDIRGVPPFEAYLSARLPSGTDVVYVDPFGWDGERWRWLAPTFTASSRARIRLPLARFVPRVVVVTHASASTPEVGVTLDPPPVAVPAAAAELPHIEPRLYQLADDSGRIRRQPPTQAPVGARRYGVLDNRDGARLRDDLITNLLIQPRARRDHRAEIVRLARRDDLDGVVLDYAGVPDDLKAVFVAFVADLADHLRARDIALVVLVDMPRRTDSGWDTDGLDWLAIGEAAEGVRIRLPNAAPLDTALLDELARWAVTRVDRRRLELAVPVYGRDLVDGSVTPIAFGDALAHVLDMARSDAPERVSPGREATIELPTVAAAEIGRDPATGMWRFYYWDANRRQHTVWLNDAAGLSPAFEIAARYRLGRVALDGGSAAVDPQVWQMVAAYRATGQVASIASGYRLAWQLVDTGGRVVQEAIQPLDASSFTLRAPSLQGDYELTVNLIAEDGAPAAFGRPAQVAVAPPPPPSPTPTLFAIGDLPTPESYATAPPPADELRIDRAPVPIGGTLAAATLAFDAEVAFASAALREEPQTSARVLSDLRRGDRLQILDRSTTPGWHRVLVVGTGLEGWVLAELVSERDGDEAAGDAPAPGGTATAGTPTPATTRPARPPARATPTTGTRSP